jgi:hypothetical protein
MAFEKRVRIIKKIREAASLKRFSRPRLRRAQPSSRTPSRCSWGTCACTRPTSPKRCAATRKSWSILSGFSARRDSPRRSLAPTSSRSKDESQQHKGRDITPRTINFEVRVLRAFFYFLINERGLKMENPLRALQAPTRSEGQSQPQTADVQAGGSRSAFYKMRR